MNNPFDKESLSQREKDLLKDGGWQCSFCATVNASYITTCACSHNQDDSYENLHGRYVPREDEEWTEAGIKVEGPVMQFDSGTSATSMSAEPTFAAFSPEPMAASQSTASTNEPAGLSAELQTEPTASPNNTAVPTTPASTAVQKPSVSNTNKPLEEYSEYEQGILKDGGWECAFCSRINANYITNCACGHSNDDSYRKRRGRYVDPEEDRQQAEPQSAPTSETPSITEEPASADPQEIGAAKIAEIEKSLENNSSDVAKIRAIRKFKDLVKNGYMTEEAFQQKKEALLSFDDEEDMTEMSSEPAETPENHQNEGDA